METPLDFKARKIKILYNVLGFGKFPGKLSQNHSLSDDLVMRKVQSVPLCSNFSNDVNILSRKENCQNGNVE